MTEPAVQELFDMTGQNVLITGASGFFGSAMSRALDEGESHNCLWKSRPA